MPVGRKSHAVGALQLADVDDAQHLLRELGALAMMPSSVFLLADRGSRFIEPMNTSERFDDRRLGSAGGPIDMPGNIRRVREMRCATG
jgi:hypothetical protein